MQKTLAQLLDRSGWFATMIDEVVEFSGPLDGKRGVLACGQAALSMQLAQALRQLLGTQLDAAAMALMRVQFESTTRAVWIASAATDAQIEAYVTPGPDGELKGPNQGKSVDDLLAAIEAGDAAHLATTLKVLKTATWRAMNHYSHGSLIAVVQATAPRHEEQLMNAVLNSNGMLLMAANVALVTTKHVPTAILGNISAAFADCLPPVAS